MKNSLRFGMALFLLHIFMLTELHAQCPPQGFPPTTTDCNAAPLLCADIDNYCGTLGSDDVQKMFPGCPMNVLNNDEYLRFVAATDSITIRITPINCDGSMTLGGMQGAIFSDCELPSLLPNASAPMKLSCLAAATSW